MERDHVEWPLGPHQVQLIGELATLIARGGSWRFLRAPVVAANVSNYPDPWEESREGVARVLARTMWHAYLDLETVLDDVRQPAHRERSRLRETEIELTRFEETRALFTLSAVGNDDVAGLISHEVGRVLVGQLTRAGHPFRTTDDGLPELAIGSIAAVYLGLGIVAANSAHHDRSAGETIGRTAYHEHKIFRAGGLDVRDLAFLLAVQATVRDDVLSGLDTLRPTQADHVAAWREILDDHEDELVTMLGLGAADTEVELSRPATPRAVVTTGSFDESNLHKFNYGRRVFRYAETRGGVGAVLGTLAGFAVTALLIGLWRVVTDTASVSPMLLIPGPVIGLYEGYRRGRRKRLFRCASCGGFVLETAAECRLCGGRIDREIKDPRHRLELEEELEEQERAAAAAAALAEPKTAPRSSDLQDG